ncbi:M28 family metallopeptidase [Chungangia koreensis]|uniref:M28 family metallopeptidase n=1 Tax=Chungangia koreensis TaxID=752657 RepID=A0ABV8X494_9LACT
MKGKLSFILVLFSLLFLVAACSDHESSDEKERAELSTEEKILKDIASLSSDEKEGRAPGTKGNGLASEELKKRFKKIGLEPVKGETYSLPFNMHTLNMDEVEKSLVVMLKDGTQKEFPYGDDWLEINPIADKYVELPISFSDGEGKIYVTDGEGKPTGKPRVKFIKTEIFKKYLLNYMSDDTFQISGTLYDYLKEEEQNVEQVQLIFAGKQSPLNPDNVVGKISGKESKKAIVISSNFDHVGKAGNRIFRGSVQNASGVAAMLELAEVLKKESENQGFDADIIFAAFNGEESGLFGSKAFVSEISSNYESVLDINLDSIGYKDGGKIQLIGKGTNSRKAADELSKFAEELNIATTQQFDQFQPMTQSFESFIEEQYQAVNITQENFDLAYSEADQLDVVDVKPIVHTIDIVKGFVLKNHSTDFPKIDPELTMQLLAEETAKQMEGLKFGEYKFFKSEVTGNNEIAFKVNKDLTDEEIKDMKDSLSENGFSINKASITYKLDEEVFKNKDEVNQVFRLDEEKMKPDTVSLGILYNDYNILVTVTEEFDELPEHKDVYNDWLLFEDWKKKDTYNWIIRNISSESNAYSVMAQSYNDSENRSRKPMEREMVEKLVNTFDLQQAIKIIEQ